MRKFGIELEVTRRLVNIAYHDRAKNKNWTELSSVLTSLMLKNKISNGWKLKTDTSCGGEIVSPPLDLSPGGLAEVSEVVAAVNKFAETKQIYPVDNECGLHVHIGAPDATPKSIGRLFGIVNAAEAIFYAVFKHRSNKYCARMDVNPALAKRFRDWFSVREAWYRGSNNIRNPNMKYETSFLESSSSGDPYDGTRYHGFNIHCFWKIKTVEFRYAPGTFDIEAILSYIDICSSIYEASMSPGLGNRFDADEMESLARVNAGLGMSRGFNGRKRLVAFIKKLGLKKPTIAWLIANIKKNSPLLLAKTDTSKPIWLNANDEWQKEVYFLYINGREYTLDGLEVTKINSKSAYNKLLIRCENGIPQEPYRLTIPLSLTQASGWLKSARNANSPDATSILKEAAFAQQA